MRKQKSPTKIKGQEMEKLTEMMTQLMADVKEIRRENTEYRKELIEVRKENDEFKKEIVQMKMKISELEETGEQREREERRSRKNNIVINGLNMRNKSEDEIKKEVEELIENMELTPKIKAVKRVHENICMVEMKEFECKIEIMKNRYKLKKLENRKIYIDSDLTYKERKIQKHLREIAAEARSKSSRVKVGYKYIIVDGTKWIWNEKGGSLEKDETGKTMPASKN